MSVITLVAGNTLGRDELAWQFLKDNWDELDRRYGEGGFAIMRLVGIASSVVSVVHQLECNSSAKFFNRSPFRPYIEPLP